jgi:hypothetical protein
MRLAVRRGHVMDWLAGGWRIYVVLDYKEVCGGDKAGVRRVVTGR